MASKLQWSDLRIGITALVVILAIVFSILLFARVGALHGDTDTVYITTDDATGVLPGTEVSLAGRKVGLVEAIRFRPITTDTLKRVMIETRILHAYTNLIRKNSAADIRPGGNLIGSMVVYIRLGTSVAPSVRNGDTIGSHGSGRIKALGRRVDSVMADIGATADSTTKMLALLSNQSNNFGAFRARGMPRIASAHGVWSGIVNKARTGNGSLGLAARGDIGGRIGGILAAKDSVVLLFSSGEGNIGRFHRDSTLFREVASVRAEMDSLRSLFSRSGSVTRLRSDTSLTTEIGSARAQLDSLMKEIKKHPMRYLRF